MSTRGKTTDRRDVRAGRDAPAAIRKLGYFFRRNGYTRWQLRRRVEKDGSQLYKKGDEIRFVANAAGELTVIRRLLRAAGFRPGRPFVKGRQYRLPIYGRKAVAWFLAFVGRSRKPSGGSPLERALRPTVSRLTKVPRKRRGFRTSQRRFTVENVTRQMEFEATFHALRGVLKKYEKHLTVADDKPGNYGLNAGYSEKWKRVIFFGAAHIRKSYVSFYLMPVYMFPDLLRGVSKGLQARMQGKSCFKFRSIPPGLLKEVHSLARKSFTRFRKEGLA